MFQKMIINEAYVSGLFFYIDHSLILMESDCIAFPFPQSPQYWATATEKWKKKKKGEMIDASILLSFGLSLEV